MDDPERFDSQPAPAKREVNVVVEILAWAVAAVALTATAYAAARYFVGWIGVG